MDFLTNLIMIYIGCYIFISFTPIQDYLLEKDNLFLYPLKCLACLYVWTSLLFMVVNISLYGYSKEQLFIWLISCYINLRLNKN